MAKVVVTGKIPAVALERLRAEHTVQAWEDESPIARDELLKHRPEETPVILATNLGRDGETVRIVPLGDLNVDDVDMLTVVVVGSSESRTVTTGDGKTWVYTPRGYSGKADSGMKGIEA